MDNNTLLANLLQHPEKVGPVHIPILQEFLLKFPFVQPLHALLAKVDENYIPKAALYSNNTALHKILQVDYTSVGDSNQKDFTETIFDNVADRTSKKLNENLIIESAIANDFFSFEQSFTTETVNDEIVSSNNTQFKLDDTVVSKYDDDALPYTFLWWLAKTRKEHAQIFQPYAQPIKNVTTNKANGPDFQQQYVEHIFHIQTPFEVSDHLADFKPNIDKDPKSTEIIDRFLKEDPTIKAPKPEQIDNENKAKKSAEDHYDLVSETLAKIYIEQMLYHKAIDTYKKLSLKYPEKSRYFADLIQSIEKKF